MVQEFGLLFNVLKLCKIFINYGNNKIVCDMSSALPMLLDFIEYILH